MKMKLKKLVRSAKCLVLSAALCAVGLSAWAEEPDAVQLWKDGPYFATCNVGTPETHDPAYPAEYGALYTFDDADTAVKSILGQEWRVPSDGELKMLAGKNDGDKVCSNVWTTCNGVAGRRFFGMTSGYEDKSVFLPAAGYASGSDRKDAGGRGYCWSSEPYDDGSALYLYFDGSGTLRVSGNARSYGMSVRAVRDTPPPPTPPEPSDEEVVATAEATFVLGPALAVANVKTATHWPWDGKIDVTCDLTGAGKVTLGAALTTNGVKVCDATAANLTGATTINLDAAGGATNGVRLVWDAKADCPAGFNSKDTKVKVTAKKVVPPAGALPGEFSVSADKKVLFSQGNLVATIDASGTPTAWKFATNQYDYLGEGGANKLIGQATEGGDVDLFGWSTSATKYGISKSKADADYSGDFVDWGTAIDSNGTWRTLSYNEWKYLFNSRTNASSLYKCGVTVCDKTNCLIIAPDNWDTSATPLQASYDDATAWATAEAAGLVCIPFAGRRDGSNVRDDVSYYWSSTKYGDGDDKARYMQLNSNSVTLNSFASRYYGYSVRLVTEVK